MPRVLMLSVDVDPDPDEQVAELAATCGDDGTWLRTNANPAIGAHNDLLALIQNDTSVIAQAHYDSVQHARPDDAPAIYQNDPAHARWIHITAIEVYDPPVPIAQLGWFRNGVPLTAATAPRPGNPRNHFLAVLPPPG